MARSDLASLAREFAAKLQTLLNGTVADNAQVAAVGLEPKMVAVGTNLNAALKTSPVRLRSVSRRFCCWLDIQVQLFKPDDYLTVKQSYFGVLADPADDNPLFHFDYERDKRAYTEAHVQVFGANGKLDPMILELCVKRKKKHMGELHFPVGGRRFRPALEDVLEFLIDEDLVEPKPGWKPVLDKTRDEFRRIQLMAVVRRDPDAAVEVLRALNYSVDPPGSILQRLRQSTRGKRRTF